MMLAFSLPAPWQKNQVQYLDFIVMSVKYLQQLVCWKIPWSSISPRWPLDHGHRCRGGHGGGEEDAARHHAGLHDHHTGEPLKKSRF